MIGITGHAVACLDHEQIRAMIKNLLGNALKFTPVGGAILLSLAEGFMGDMPAFLLQVRDTGPGIPAEELDCIFEPFVQSAGNSRQTGGSGLGLAICRAIVAAHGGTIAASNHPDGGALFTVWLPKMQDTSPSGESQL
ncbi:MAG: ATP-binding protein [Magnetococcales bacterium]|nr:ATP-binding protein [Magnetococcales bacterium]